MSLRPLLVPLLIFLTQPLYVVSVFSAPPEDESRFCYGFLYCRSTDEGTTYEQAFLYLYYSEERGTYSRLMIIPFYSREMDPSTKYLRRSYLWPFGISEVKGDSSYAQILPFYWHSEDPQEQYTFALPLYFDYATPAQSYTHFIPFYGHHVRAPSSHSYFLLGPLAMASYDEAIDLKGWDILFPLFHYRHDINGSESRIFPLYFSGESLVERSSYRYVIPIYGRSRSSESDSQFLFPLFGSLEEHATQAIRTSAVGLPPLKGSWPALALYEHGSSPTSMSDRLFPLYHYAYAIPDDTSQLDILALFQLRKGPALTAHRFFPLYQYEDDRSQNQFGWSLLGYEQYAIAGYGRDSATLWHQLLPLYRSSEDLTTRAYDLSVLGVGGVSMFRYWTAPSASGHRLFPLYSTSDNLTTQTRDTSILGMGPLSLFRSWRSPSGNGHRLFPLYDYEHPQADEWHWSALLSGPLSLYRHDAKGTAIRDRFFPLYDWRRNGDWRELGVFGVSNFSLFYREAGPTLHAHRLFPIYRYRNDLAADDISMETLFLHRHASTPAQGHDRFLLLWDAAWQRRESGWEVDLLGLKPATWFHHETSPLRTANRLFPLYGYQNAPAGPWRLSLLGFPPRDESFAWSFYEHGSSPSYFLTRLFPLYSYERNDESNEVHWSGLLLYQHRETETELLDMFPPFHEYERDRLKGSTELSLLGIKPLSLFQHATGPETRSSFLFPLYEYEQKGEATRLSMIGWPKVGTATTLSLFEREDTPSLSAHRLFPLYRYRRDDVAKTRDWDALLLWWHRETEDQLRDVWFPIVDIFHDKRSDEYELGALGIRPLTYFHYRSSPVAHSHSAALLYKYSVDGDYHRFSALGFPHVGSAPALSLFALERSPSFSAHRFFPLYHYAKDDQAGTLNWQALLLWWHRHTGTHSQNTFVPFTDIEWDSQAQSRRVSVLGLPRTGGLPAITLFNWEHSPSMSALRFFPVYDYVRDDHAQTLNWQALLLWWHRETATTSRTIVPLLADVASDSDEESHRISVLGLPRMGSLPAMTMFNWERHPSLLSHRVFPLYQYSYDHAEEATSWNALWLYWHHSDPSEVRNTLFPLGSLRKNFTQENWSFSALGVEPLSLAHFAGGPDAVRNRFSPLWDYEREGTHSSFALLGIRSLSLFAHDATTDERYDHLFPLWWHLETPAESMNLLLPVWSDFEDHQAQERQLGVLGVGPLSLYYQQRTPLGQTARIFPVWSYEYDERTQTTHTGVIGVAPLSLYYGRTTPTTQENRLFPFFRYTSDLMKDESEFWFLWPLFDHKTAEGRTIETSVLWGLFQYRSPKPDEWEYWVMGHPPIAMYMRVVTPTKTLVEVNPIIPGWRREYVEGIGTSWALFGGLIGMDAMPDGTHKLRLFWMRWGDDELSKP